MTVLVSNSTSSLQAAFCYFFFFACPAAQGILVSSPGMELMPPELESLCPYTLDHPKVPTAAA